MFRARRGQVAYGYPVGILCAQWHIPFVPGDLNNATTFEFPVRYLSVPGSAGSAVLAGTDGDFAARFVAAARTLEAEGVRAITGNCGFMASYQQQVAAAVRVPVFMSSLIQAPMLLHMLGPAARIGVLVANRASVTDRVLAGAGVTATERLVFQGLDHQPHWHEVIIQETGLLDFDRLRDEVVGTATALVADHPEIGALMLECSDLPPYASAVHAATGLPVFDWAGFIRYVHDAAVPRSYTGLF